MDELMLDGNAVAGLLAGGLRRRDDDRHRCVRWMREIEPMGSTHVFRGAGVVLRCPHCDNVLVKIVKDETRMWIGLPGVGTLEVAV